MDFNVTDTSNYMIETSKSVTAGTDLFEIEFISEYGFIADGLDNELYVITKKADGTPIKTYSTVTIKNITKDMKNILANLKVERNALIIVSELNENLVLATRNLNNVLLLEASEINVLDLVSANLVIVEESAIKEIEEALV